MVSLLDTVHHRHTGDGENLVRTMVNLRLAYQSRIYVEPENDECGFLHIPVSFYVTPTWLLILKFPNEIIPHEQHLKESWIICKGDFAAFGL